ncbi:MAG TPA: amino acid--tRNA ligase-related protein, partial [Planctomycetota bacterium]
RHNPEFTMLEFYAAFTDYRGMADLTEDLIAGAARAAGLEADGQLVARFRGREYDLSPPYPRERYADLFQKALGFAPGDSDAVTAALAARGMERPAGAARYAHWKAVNDLFEAAVEPELDGPVFVMDYPQAISPLAKPCPGDPEWTERFEFFLGGMELANAFSELNDPQLQLENFRRQLDTKDPEAPNEIDWDYVRALAYGMPPAGGCGIGIDRVAMVLLGVDTIREVLLFPLLRPESELPDFGDAAVAETPAGAQG